jgi:hypothetical protein
MERVDTLCHIEVASVVLNKSWKIEFITARLAMLSNDRSPVSLASCSFTGML